MAVPKIKAVIPSAGMGTRMLPYTARIPKEMMNIGPRPAIQYVVEEIYAAGIREIAIIINKKKTIMMEYFLEKSHTAYRGHPEMAMFEELKRNVRFTFLYQSRPLGVADAVFRARDFIGDEPFALVFPDNIVFSRNPGIGQLLDRYRRSGVCGAMVGLHRIREKEMPCFGNCGGVQLGTEQRGVWPVLKLQSKGAGHFKVKPGQGGVRMFPRLILPAAFFRHVSEEKRKHRGGELDDVPILQRFVREKALWGMFVQGKVYDIGNIQGYYAAVAYLGRKLKKRG